MSNNPILDELHETRARLYDEAGGTIEALVAKLQRDGSRSGRQFVRLKGSTEPGLPTSEVRAMQAGSRPVPLVNPGVEAVEEVLG